MKRLDSAFAEAASCRQVEAFPTGPPGQGHPLLEMEDVIISPHIGFFSEESIRELKRKTAKKVSDVLTGKWPEFIVNQEVRTHARAKIGG